MDSLRLAIANDHSLLIGIRKPLKYWAELSNVPFRGRSLWTVFNDLTKLVQLTLIEDLYRKIYGCSPPTSQVDVVPAVDESVVPQEDPFISSHMGGLRLSEFHQMINDPQLFK